jgi:hypothetical protein
MPPSGSLNMITDYVARVIADVESSRDNYADFIRSNISAHPIPFFGDVENAKVLTVGVNPSATEFLNRGWPAKITALELANRLRSYFASPTVQPHSWFETWRLALANLDVSYTNGAAHVDLSPRATVSMGAIVDWQLFGSMVERDAKWFFELISLLKRPQALLIAGCVTKRWYIHQFIARIAPQYGYRLEGKAEQTGAGRVGFFRLHGPGQSIPVFFCSVSPSGQKPEILIERIKQHRCSITGWMREPARGEVLRFQSTALRYAA